MIKNLNCVNITPQTDVVKWTVNTSSIDRTSSTDNISGNKEVGVAMSSTDYVFYIHSQTVNSIKYSVEASKFSITGSSDNIGTITKVDLGNTGYYSNVVKVTVPVQYNGNTTVTTFPDKNEELYLTFAGTPTIAIDQ